MNASVTFRDEKSPLIRMKFPVTLAGFPLMSGIVLGDNQDLSLHLGTSPEACPSVKIAYRPNFSSSCLSLIVKAGIGPWGPPRASSLSLSAEVRLSRAPSGPFFALHVKPRLGDFGLRKMAKLASFVAMRGTPNPTIENDGDSESLHDISADAVHEVPTVDETSHSGNFYDVKMANKDISDSSRGLFGDKPAFTPLHEHKTSPFTAMNIQDSPFNGTHVGIPEEAESVDNWGNDYVKVECFDNSNKTFQEGDTYLSRKNNDDRTSNIDNFGDCRLLSENPLCASAVDVSCIRKPGSASMIKTADFFPVPWRWGVDESSQGWNLHAHTSLPLGANTALKFRWGVNAHHDLLQGWDSQLPSFKLPYLCLQKISIVTIGIDESCKKHNLPGGAHLPLIPQHEEIHELSPVFALCGSMKHQLQLLHAENLLLRKAMEDMKTQFKQEQCKAERACM